MEVRLADGNMPVLGAKERNCTSSQFLKAFPMSLLSEEWARRNHGQSLNRLRERGGLSLVEMVANLERREVPRGMDPVRAEARLVEWLAGQLNGGRQMDGGEHG
jgi:hypothetical protein